MLLGRHCPSPTPPEAEQGREDPPGPATVHNHSSHWPQSKALVAMSQGDSQLYGRGEHSCSLGTHRTGEQTVLVMQATLQESPKCATAFVAFGNCLPACCPCSSRRCLRS